jgi:GNAT superfamily N-acetyltransferase
MVYPPVHRAPGTFRTRPLTPATWQDLEELFDLPGGSIVRGCWCMYYRHTGRAVPGVDNKQALHDLVDKGVVAGLVGYLDDSPVGWISLGPREEYLKLRRSPIMKPVDGEQVWSLVCSYIAKPYRGLGLQHQLLAAAIGFAGDNCVRMLEAYPVDKAERSHDDFMFFGSRSLYESAGFREVVRRSPSRVVMRLDLHPGSSSAGGSPSAQ